MTLPSLAAPVSRGLYSLLLLTLGGQWGNDAYSWVEAPVPRLDGSLRMPLRPLRRKRWMLSGRHDHHRRDRCAGHLLQFQSSTVANGTVIPQPLATTNAAHQRAFAARAEEVRHAALMSILYWGHQLPLKSAALVCPVARAFAYQGSMGIPDTATSTCRDHARTARSASLVRYVTTLLTRVFNIPGSANLVLQALAASPVRWTRTATTVNISAAWMPGGPHTARRSLALGRTTPVLRGRPTARLGKPVTTASVSPPV